MNKHTTYNISFLTYLANEPPTILYLTLNLLKYQDLQGKGKNYTHNKCQSIFLFI